MQAALALTTDGHGPARRRGRRRDPWVLLASLGVHGLILAGLIAGVHIMPPLIEPPAISVELLNPSIPSETIARPSPTRPMAQPQPASPTPVKTAPSPAPPAAKPPSPAPVVRAPAPTTDAPKGAIAPPGFKARELTGGGDALREAARDGIGCRNADELALTKAQRAVCDEKLGEKNKNRPAMYAVIDPDKKAAFDGECKKDDDWCLYRAGKGPYPGLFALGKKKKIKGWDD